MSVRQSAGARATSLVLLGGSLLSAVCFVVGVGLGLVSAGDAAALVASVGVLVLLSTPALGLVASAFELRRAQPHAAWLALAVLGVLGLAVGVALLAR